MKWGPCPISNYGSHESCWIEVTKDGGKTWFKRGPIVLKNTAFGIVQPALFWGPRPTLKMFCRPTMELKRLCIATSRDEGKTWSVPRITDIPNPGNPVDLQNLNHHRLVMVHNPLEDGRYQLAASLSYDDGKTFPTFIYLENGAEDDEFAFHFLIPDKSKHHCTGNRIHCVYAYETAEISTIKYVILKFNE